MNKFSAEPNNEGIVNIKWSTSSEFELDHYIIERTSDGLNFETIAIVSGKNSTSENKYQAQDSMPLEGNVYYRLKEFNLDGSQFDVNIIQVLTHHLIKTNSFQFLKSEGTIVVKIPDELVSVHEIGLYDLAGKQLFKQNFSEADNYINTSILPQGIYLIAIKMEGKTVTKKMQI